VPGTGSLRPDFTVALHGTSNCLCPECHLVKSGRRDLTTGIYASDTSHPVPLHGVNHREHRKILQLREMREEEENQEVHPHDVPVRLDRQIAELVVAGEGSEGQIPIERERFA
jgi:hypothetical protein